MDPISKLHSLGQSLWYDNIQRGMLENGEFAGMIERGEIRGVTSNPSIFHNAIGKTSEYDTALLPMAWSGWTAAQIIDRLMLEDIQAAADLFLPLYRQTNGGDGYVSLEVHPDLAHSTEETIREAARLFEIASRPNVMIKIPGTKEGIPAIAASIAAGINVNVTLIFSLTRYAEVMEAYLSGLEERAAAGKPIDRIASVASFFVSRVDSKIDGYLQAITRGEGAEAEKAQNLAGKAAIANAKLAYARYLETFGSDRFRLLKEKGARVQRPLWASTSTKNPAYPDVLYVEGLIGPDTVNTVPAQTLVAYRDHGPEARLTLTSGLTEAKKALDDLESLGISMEKVTADLETEGVKAFSDAMAALVRTVDERISSAQKQLGPLRADVPKQVKILESISVAPRLWSQDPGLWTEDPTGQQEIKRRLGWLNLPFTSQKLIEETYSLANVLVAEGFSHVLLLGMGGSSLAPEVLQEIFARQPHSKLQPGLTLNILDSTDPDQVRAAERIAPIKKTVFVVSSKSGGTSEVNAFLNYFWDKAKRKLKARAGRNFIAITDPGTSLEKLAAEKGFRKIFLADPTVGGRSSALSAFGLVPAGLIGVDLEKFLNQSAWIARQCGPDVPHGRNPGLVLGAVIGEAVQQGRDKLTFLTDPEWKEIGAWLEQLIAESSGKMGKGIVPVDGEAVGRKSVYGNDRLFIHIRGKGEYDDTARRLLRAGHPVLTLPIADANGIAAEFFRWEVATAIACAIMNVNAFDQPDVQDNKNRTLEKIAVYSQNGKLDEGRPVWKSSRAKVYGQPFEGLDKARTLAEVVEAFLKLSKPGDYLALNAYLPRTPRNAARLDKVRTKLRNRWRLATTVGFGPRFLHSTGQLHKGGPDKGIFIQITKDSEKDLPIPGSDYSFQVLERAQSLGDLEALQARGRRVIRIHLLDGAIKDLA